MKNMDNEKMNELIIGVCKSLTDDQKEKAKDCKDVNELAKCLGEMGVALPDELMEAVAGGAEMLYQPISGYMWAETTCKRCGDPFWYQYYYNMVLEGHKDGGPYKPDFCPKCENPAEFVGR